MAEYRITCTTQEPSNVPNDRAHIVAVARGLVRDEFDGRPSAPQLPKSPEPRAPGYIHFGAERIKPHDG
jgi:hypothetical protein